MAIAGAATTGGDAQCITPRFFVFTATGRHFAWLARQSRGVMWKRDTNQFVNDPCCA
ncbi:hypothetical protein OKW26_000023 [Paraburkholderia sp. 32]